MKNKLILIIGSLMLLSQAAMAQTLTVSASIPQATGITLTVTPINATTQVAGTPSTTATTIPFGTLQFNSTYNIYEPVDYYTIGISASGGAGTPIANRLGYQNLESFIRMFEMIMKLSPTQYRLKNQKKSLKK